MVFKRKKERPVDNTLSASNFQDPTPAPTAEPTPAPTPGLTLPPWFIGPGRGPPRFPFASDQSTRKSKHVPANGPSNFAGIKDTLRQTSGHTRNATATGSMWRHASSAGEGQDGAKGRTETSDLQRSVSRHAMLRDKMAPPEDAPLLRAGEPGRSDARSDGAAALLSNAGAASQSDSIMGAKRRLLSPSMPSVNFAANDVASESVIVRPHSTLMRYLSMGLAVVFILLAALDLARRFRTGSLTASLRHIPRSRVV
jgi:hypothetical protein